MIKLTKILTEIIDEKISDDPFHYHKHIKRLEKLLNVKVTDHMKSGTRSSVFTLKDGRVMKITSDPTDAAGLKYAMDNHPHVPVLKVFSINRFSTGGSDAYGNGYYDYVAIVEKLKPTDDDERYPIISWFYDNTGVKPADVHDGNIGISSDKSTPLHGVVFLDPSFEGMRSVSGIKIIGDD